MVLSNKKSRFYQSLRIISCPVYVYIVHKQTITLANSCIDSPGSVSCHMLYTSYDDEVYIRLAGHGLRVP